MMKKNGCVLGNLLADKINCSSRKLRPEKRAAIIEATIREVVKRGFHGASMDRIAFKARVSKRTVYNHFESKENLLSTIVRERREQTAGTVGVEYDSAVPLEEQLMTLGRQEVAFIRVIATEGLTRALLAECIRAPEFAAHILGELRDNEAGVPAWVRAAADDGRLTTHCPELAAQQFISLLKGALFWPVIFGGADVPDNDACEAVLGEAVTMFLARYSS